MYPCYFAGGSLPNNHITPEDQKQVAELLAIAQKAEKLMYNATECRNPNTLRLTKRAQGMLWYVDQRIAMWRPEHENFLKKRTSVESEIMKRAKLIQWDIELPLMRIDLHCTVDGYPENREEVRAQYRQQGRKEQSKDEGSEQESFDEDTDSDERGQEEEDSTDSLQMGDSVESIGDLLDAEVLEQLLLLDMVEDEENGNSSSNFQDPRDGMTPEQRESYEAQLLKLHERFSTIG